RWSGLALCAALSIGWAFRLPRLKRDEYVGFACGVVLTAIVGAGLLLGHLTRLSQASALLRFSFAHSKSSLPAAERWVALEAWFGEAGLLGLVLAALGGLVLMRVARERRLACAFLVFLAFDLFVPGRSGGLAPDNAGGLRLMAVLGLVIFSVACARHVLEAIERLRVPFARVAAAGALAYALILLLIGVDQGQSRGREDEEIAAATFTSEALASLPAGSALLLRSEAVWRRMLTAQAVSGLRSDLSVVPMPVVESGSINAEAYAGHTGLLPLVRDMLLSGKPSEYALSALADARPTYVELDPAWDLRLQSHLAPHGFFLAFAPQPLARSERAAEPPRVRRGLLRVAARVRPGSGPRAAMAQGADAQRGAGRAVVDALARRAALLAGLGDLEPAQQELRTLLEISPSDRGSLTLKQRLDRTPKGRVETRDLFAAR
ncbi:MAG TPA: hypothetical protein VFQ61_15645, partial [Polyangiaceae bacterium]|nr:hypothetical protein [Polyangiaceae bacterium]